MPHYWPFVRGIRRPKMDFPDKCCESLIFVMLLVWTINGKTVKWPVTWYAMALMRCYCKEYIPWNMILHNNMRCLNIQTSEYNINSFWPSDTIWRHRSWSTLAQVMACCLTAPSHYLNQCWLIVKSSDIHIRAISQEMSQLSVTTTRLKITYIKFHSNFPGTNEIIYRLTCNAHIINCTVVMETNPQLSRDLYKAADRVWQCNHPKHPSMWQQWKRFILPIWLWYDNTTTKCKYILSHI